MNKLPDERTKNLTSGKTEISDETHVNGVFISCMVIVVKLLILTLARFTFFAINEYDQKAIVFTNPVASILLVISLLLVHFAFCIMQAGLSSVIKWTINVILLGVEVLIVLNCELNVIVMTMLGDIIVFHVFTAILTKVRHAYYFKINIVFILLLFVVSVAVIAITCEKYFQDTSFSYFKLNALIAGLVYCIWTSLFFNVRSNIELMKAENYSFAISHDLFYIMAEILQEIKVEFTFQDDEPKEDQQNRISNS